MNRAGAEVGTFHLLPQMEAYRDAPDAPPEGVQNTKGSTWGGEGGGGVGALKKEVEPDQTGLTCGWTSRSLVYGPPAFGWL